MKKNPYELLNDIETDLTEYDEKPLTPYENKKLKKRLTKNLRNKRWRRYASVAAIAGVVLMATTVIVEAAYQSRHTSLYNSIFGNQSRTSQPVKDEYNGYSGTFEMPSVEYIPVDEEKTDAMIGEYIGEESHAIEVQGYTVTAINHIYDEGSQSGRVYFSIESEKTLTPILDTADDRTNEVYFPYDESLPISVGLSYEDKNSPLGKEFPGFRIILDRENSTENKLFASFVYADSKESAGKIDSMSLNIFESVGEEEVNEVYCEVPKAESIPYKSISGVNDQKKIAFSSIGIYLDMESIIPEMAVDGSIDPYYIKHVELVYEDGSNYVLKDNDQNISNVDYGIGGGAECGSAEYDEETGEMKEITNVKSYNGMVLCYNRVIDMNDVAKVVINDQEFMIP